jgi:ATP/maltotriose-dependent transcriptional regulator MalT
MILTADAGFGKSTFAGQVCKEYKERDQLKACHFFKSTISAYSDPRKMLESLASQLCENVSGFKEKLAAQLQRKPLLTTIGDAFRVFLKDPLNSLPDEKSSILIVIDGLDESVSGEKNNFFGCNR